MGTTLNLDADCTTDETIFVPDGFTLDGNRNTITAVDPTGDHFRGAVVQNGGTTAHVQNLKITASGLVNVCDEGTDRLRGIMFDGASGSIKKNYLNNINQGVSDCQEGHAIDVRNAPYDGTHPGTQTVKISHNKLLNWQKVGILANGDVDVSVKHNKIGASATQANLTPNGLQFGFGALGVAKHNSIEGNQWFGSSEFAGTAVLIINADAVKVSQNNIRGNSDVGILIFSDGGIFKNNKVFDKGIDHPNSCCDVGIWDGGDDNTVTNNKVRGFDVPYEGVTGSKNKAVP